MFLVLAEVEGKGYYFRWLGFQNKSLYIGVPIGYDLYAGLNASPSTLVFVDENKKIIGLEDVKEEEYYRIENLGSPNAEWKYMYMRVDGTNIYFYDMYFNPMWLGFG